MSEIFALPPHIEKQLQAIEQVGHVEIVAARVSQSQPESKNSADTVDPLIMIPILAAMAVGGVGLACLPKRPKNNS